MLFTRHDERAPRVVQFTSAYPGEGKSTIARCLTILKRQAGVKTIIIDANIRKPTLRKSFNTPKQPGLAEYLSGLAAVHEIISKDKKTGTYLITAGETKRSPTDILPSRKMDDLFEDLSEDFDLIIVDSPPVLSVPDARILASRVDMSVVVIKWADTREDVVEYALKQLSEAGAPRLSTVLSMVDTKKHAQYGFADSGVYAGKLK
jgi:capsular exopolysaccharide synthesis family protein